MSLATLPYFTITQREWKRTYRIANTSILRHITARNLPRILSLVVKKGIQSLFPLHPTPSYFCFFAVLAPPQGTQGTRHAANCGSGDGNLSALQRLHREQSQHTWRVAPVADALQKLKDEASLGKGGGGRGDIKSKCYCSVKAVKAQIHH